MDELLNEVRVFAEKAAEGTEYDEAISLGLKGLDAARSLLEAAHRSDKLAVQVALTEWDDINKTFAAIGKMDSAIADATSGPSMDEVLGVIGKIVKIGVTIAAAI